MYPPARRSSHVDTYFNTPVPDPYRWMENVDSPEVEAWVTAQNQLTRSILDPIPGREHLQARLLALTDFERFSAPIVRNNRFVYAHNTGLQNQAVLLWQDGLDGEPHLLLDPNTLSADGTVALAGIALSPDGTRLAYALSEAGSDWITWHVREIGTGPESSSPEPSSPDNASHDLPDRITRSKFSSASWLPDSSGFVYSGYGLAAEVVNATESPAPQAVISTEDEAQRSRSGETPVFGSSATPATATPDDLKATQHFHKVFLHLLGTPQSADLVLYQRPDDGELLLGAHVTDDGRYLLLTASKGHTNQLHALALGANLRPTGSLIPIAPTADARYDPIDTDGDTLWLHTTSNAPNGRVVTVSLDGKDPADPAPEAWQTILPETANNLDSVSLVANTVIATYLAHAQSEVHLFTTSGQPLGPLQLPAIGTVSAFSGRRSDTESFVTFTNFTTPPAVLRLDLAPSSSSAVIPIKAKGPAPLVVIPSQSEEPASLPGTPTPSGNTRSTTSPSASHSEAQPRNPPISSLAAEQRDAQRDLSAVLLSQNQEAPAQPLTLTPFRAPRLTFNPADFLTTQVFFHSKDGTVVPMFLTHRRGLALDGTNPTLLYAYGGFNISLLPTFSPSHLLWMELGGIFAQPNLRGGGEYGEAWHEGGTRLQKQNVFDDFIAAAEFLIANGYTSPQKLAIEGGSNGGLLVGAVELQRPELFAAAVAHVGVFDMLRFDQFTIGYAWKPDYGSPSGNEGEFRALLRYSPLHNTRAGTPYPPTLVLTADHDDRVFPAHSFKFTAAMQHALTSAIPPEPTARLVVIPSHSEESASLPGTPDPTGNTRPTTAAPTPTQASAVPPVPIAPLVVIPSHSEESASLPGTPGPTGNTRPTTAAPTPTQALAVPPVPTAPLVVIPSQSEGSASLPGTPDPAGNTRPTTAAPTLIRVEVRAGHGAGMPLSKRIDQTIDVYLFLTRFLHLPPVSPLPPPGAATPTA